MFFHCAYDSPCDHHRRGGGVLTIFSSRCFASTANCIPTRVDLQVSRNDSVELTCNCRRKRRLDTAVAAGVSPAISLGRFYSRYGCLYWLLIRRNFSCCLKLISKT